MTRCCYRYRRLAGVSPRGVGTAQRLERMHSLSRLKDEQLAPVSQSVDSKRQFECPRRGRVSVGSRATASRAAIDG